MKSISALRLFTAAVAMSTALVACSNGNDTTTTAAVQQAAILDDNGVLSAVVAGQYNTAQVSTQTAAILSDPSATALNTQVVSNANAALNNLVGSTDMTTAPSGGLLSSQGLALVSNQVTDDLNDEAPADVAAVQDDVSYAQTVQGQTSALKDLIDFSLDTNNDGGAKVTNDALRTELSAESATLGDDINQAATVIAALTPDAGSASP